MDRVPASQALTRFRVLDLTQVRSGPTCVRQLADWGADVIKVEMPPAVDKGQLGGPREGFDFQNLHRNKRSLTLNLKTDKGMEIFRKLAKDADVVVENMRPGVKKRLGIDYETLSADNPGLVYASISGFGQTGPYADRPGFDQVAQGMGGLMSVTGLPGQGPVRVGIPLADLTAGIFCAQAILVALLEREVSGKGQWVQTSLLQAQIFMMDFQSARWLMDGEIPKQAGNNHPTSIPTGVFECVDGFINIAVAGQEIWRRFARAVGREDWIDNPDYESPQGRSEHRDRLNGEIAEIIRTQTSKHWVDLFNDKGIPSGPIYSMNQVFDDPQVQHLGMVREYVSPVRGKTRAVGQPIDMTRTPSTIAMPPPTPGMHKADILAELGYSADDIAALEAEGVI